MTSNNETISSPAKKPKKNTGPNNIAFIVFYNLP